MGAPYIYDISHLRVNVPTEYYLVLCEQETKFKFSSVIITMKIN